jgi:hypothetical protein
MQERKPLNIDKRYKVKEGVELFSFEIKSASKYLISYNPSGLICELTETGFLYISYLQKGKSVSDAIKKIILEFEVEYIEIVNDVELLNSKLLELGFLEMTK